MTRVADSSLSAFSEEKISVVAFHVAGPLLNSVVRGAALFSLAMVRVKTLCVWS